MEVFLGSVITGSTELYRSLVAKADSCDKDLNLFVKTDSCDKDLNLFVKTDSCDKDLNL